MVEPDVSESAPRPRATRRARWLAVPLVLFALLVALAGTAWWSLRTERGSAWLLSIAPGVQAGGVRGRLIGDFSAARLRIALPGGMTITLSDAGWKGLRIRPAVSTAWLKLEIDTLEIRRVDLAFAPSPSKQPATAPTDLRLPIELDLHSLHVGELHIGAADMHPLRDLHARLQIGAKAGAEHRIDRLSFARDTLQVSGDARIASAAPMPLEVALHLAQQADAGLPPINASLALDGPLAAPALQATLRVDGAAGKPAQSLDAHALLRPFASWPLGELQLSMKALDLSALAAEAPFTSLSGEASATSTAADRPARVDLRLSNAAAGRWNEGRLPVRSATLTLTGRPDQPDALTLQNGAIELGNTEASAGHLDAHGQWSTKGWAIEALLTALQPALLDARAPTMRLDGSLAVDGGKPSAPGRIDAKAKLAGRLDQRGVPRPVTLVFDATVADQRIEIRDLRASASGGRASLKGVVIPPSADAQWAIKAQAALVDVEPALWWPGLTDSANRTLLSRLNANADIDLRLPTVALQRPPIELLAAIRGQAMLTLKPSTLAGVPVTGSASLHNNGGAAATAGIDLDADGNRLHASGRLANSGNGSADAWDMTLDAQALAKLAPIVRLLQPAGPGGDAATAAGSVTAKAQLHGRWPALSTQGQLDASGVRVGVLSIASAQAHWSLASSAAAPVEAEATLTQVGITQGAAPGPSLESLQLDLRGTGRAHTLSLTAASKALPPAWAEAVQPSAAPTANQGTARTVATLQAQGGLTDAAGKALAGWRGTIQQLDLRSNAPGATPLLHTQVLAIEALWGDGPARATVQPGRADLLGGALRWSRIAWQAADPAGGAARIDADAELEPVRIAPILARLQPDFGWGGDLTIGGHLKLHSAPGFSADVVIERHAGDLTVTEELGTRTLGLTDLRFGLAADHGIWNFTQALAGKTVGVASGAVVVHTGTEALWPPADAPIQGVLELQVTDLGSWGPWVPPGWRLEGAVHSSASIGGRFGAPEYTGSIEGTKLAVRNFLQGVDVSDGDLAIRLSGSSAQIEHFTAKAGDGSLKITGNAGFGNAPQALLTITADKFRLLGRVDRRIVASGQGRLQIDAKTLAFDGAFNVDEGLIDFSRSDAPSLSTDVVVLRPQGVPSPAAAASAAATAAAPPVTVTPSREVALDLKVTLGEKLRLKGHGIDTGLRGELRLTAPGGKLAVNGSVRTADGTYAAYGQKLTIDRGVISFSGAVDNPRLDIEATRPNLDVRVGVEISGTANNPRVRLFSDPDLSDIDKLSWLVMGRASDTAGSGDTALLQSAALGLLAGEGGGPTDKLTKALGLDELTVHQSDGDVKETVVALGKQISRRWYVGYEHGLNATTGSFQLIYRIAQRITLRAQSGDDNSLDLIWTWRWQ